MTKYSFEHQGFKVWPNIHSSIKVSRCDRIFIRVSRFQGVTKYSIEHQGFKVWPNIHSSIKVSMWYQIFNRVSRFQCGTKYSFKLERRIVSIIAGIIVSIIAGIIVGRTIVRVQASKYGCHSLATVFWGAWLWTWTCARTKSPGWKVIRSRVVLTCSALVVQRSEAKSFNISWANDTWWETPSRYCTTDGAWWRTGSIFALVMLISNGKWKGQPTAGILQMILVPSVGLLFHAYANSSMAGTHTVRVAWFWVAMVTALLAYLKNRSILTDWWLPFAAALKQREKDIHMTSNTDLNLLSASTWTMWQNSICRRTLSRNAIARLLERMDLRGTRMTKPVRLDMAPSMCVCPCADVATPGDHKSTCRMENGAVMSHEKQTLLDTQQLDCTAEQCEQVATQSLISEVYWGQMK